MVEYKDVTGKRCVLDGRSDVTYNVHITYKSNPDFVNSKGV